MGKYDDIINLPHPTSKTHKRMSIEVRSAQFAPFAALVGYEDTVKEVARLTNKRIEIDDGLKEILSDKLNIIENEIRQENEYSFTYFIPDTRKDGGEYVIQKGIPRRIDQNEKKIYLKSGLIIPIDEIISISKVKELK